MIDALRTLLLARSHIVVLDPDLAAGAATRPMRDEDVEKFEDELAQLGFVMSLDLAMTIRRLPNQAIRELRNWLIDTLATTLGAHRPHVPLFRGFPAATPKDTRTLLLRRIATWLLTCPGQPCPWCGEITAVAALDPCGHLVCQRCWDGGTYGGCPICHRRVAHGDPFIRPAALDAIDTMKERVQRHDGQLRLLHLAFDLAGTAKERFAQLVARRTPLSPDDRAEVETMIDALGPKAATWLPKTIAVRETMAICVGRLWLISPDRQAIVRATADHLKTATDVLRVAVVLMGGNPGLDEPLRLGPIARRLRRAVLEALDALDANKLVDDVRRHRSLWKRVGERLHPYEHAKRLPTAALAFAVVRDTKVSAATFGRTLTVHAGQLSLARIEDDRVRVCAWGGAIEDALRAGDARAAAEQLAVRPGDLLRRADHLVRLAQAKQPEAVTQVVRAIQAATLKGAPGTLLVLGAHVVKRTAPWPRRVFLPKGEVLRAWSTPDHRAPLPADAIGAIAGVVRETLVARAEARRMFPRGVIDRALADLLVPIGERSASKAKIASHTAFDAVGGKAAHVGKDVADLAGTGARPTLWDVAAIHAAARANVIYVRERDGTFTQYRRRDREGSVQRLARLHGSEHDGALPQIAPANAPTWFALLTDDLALPKGSEGYVLDARRGGDGITRLAAADLVAQLAAK